MFLKNKWILIMKILSQISLRTRLLLITAASIAFCSTIAILSFLYFNQQELYTGVIEKSRAIHLRLEAASTFVATQQGLGPVIDRMKSRYKSVEQMTKEDKEVVLKQVPIVAAMKIGAMNADKDNYEFRIFSDEPRNEGNQATKEELVIFKKFEGDPSLKEHTINNGESITVYRPVRLNKDTGCLTCHGAPAESPWNNGKDILGYQMENWKDGKLHGVFAIRTDLNALSKMNSSKNTISPEAILIFSIITGAIISIFVASIMIKKPIANLNQIASELSDSGSHVSSVATQIASTTEDLSHATTEQAASLQETSASIEEINSMIQNNTENAKKAALISGNSVSSAERGKEVINQMIKTINDINASNNGIAEQINKTNEEIANIVLIINDIGAKTKVINDIVFQTKLLSFNASVEAARAGEQGKGFAVVAEEVGNLAAMSGTAALEITNMLDGSIKTVEEIVKNSKDKIEKLVQEGKEKVTTGTRVAEECEGVFSEILTNISDVSKMVSEISGASQEQGQGVSEINRAIAQLDQVTHQNTSNATQSASAVAILSTQATQMNTIVQKLVSIIEGKNENQNS